MRCSPKYVGLDVHQATSLLPYYPSQAARRRGRECADHGLNVTRVMRPPGPTAQQAWREMQSTAQ